MLHIPTIASIVFLLAFGASAQRNQPETAAPQPPAAGPSVGSGAGASRLAADAGAGADALVRPATTDVDGDIGIPGFSPGNCRPLYSGDAGRIGPVTGDAEKDTIGHVATDPCRS